MEVENGNVVVEDGTGNEINVVDAVKEKTVENGIVVDQVKNGEEVSGQGMGQVESEENDEKESGESLVKDDVMDEIQEQNKADEASVDETVKESVEAGDNVDAGVDGDDFGNEQKEVVVDTDVGIEQKEENIDNVEVVDTDVGFEQKEENVDNVEVDNDIGIEQKEENVDNVEVPEVEESGIENDEALPIDTEQGAIERNDILGDDIKIEIIDKKDENVEEIEVEEKPVVEEPQNDNSKVEESAFDGNDILRDDLKIEIIDKKADSEDEEIRETEINKKADIKDEEIKDKEKPVEEAVDNTEHIDQISIDRNVKVDDIDDLKIEIIEKKEAEDKPAQVIEKPVEEKSNVIAARKSGFENKINGESGKDDVNKENQGGRKQNNKSNMLQNSIAKFGGTPSKKEKGMFKTIQPEKCVACKKTVYAVEKFEINNHIYHKNCFKCSHCSATLTAKTFSMNEGVVYCTNHFKQLFARKGNYDEGFGRQQYKKRWQGDHPPEGATA